MTTTPTTPQPLKPCPFCGHEKSEFVRLAYIVECCACGCRHESSGEGDLNGQSWNERAQTTQPEPFSDEDIMKIAREAAAGGAFRRDGSTSLRVGRAIESATADAWRSHLAAMDAEVAALREALQRILDWDAAGMALTDNHIAQARVAIDRAGGARDGA